MSTVDTAVLVVGAGPAGLAASRELRRRRIDHLVLERGAEVGHTWANLYDSLTLHTGKHMSKLPGMRFARSVPLFPTRAHFVEYLQQYAHRFELPIRTDVEVRRAERVNGRWRITTGAGEITSRALVVATGIVSNPRIPDLRGRARFRGRVLHSAEYRRPQGFEDRRVLIVGVGNSGGEIGSELACAGARVTVAVRSGANVVPLQLLGLPIQYAAYAIGRLPVSARAAIAAAIARITELRRGAPVLPRPPHSALERIPLIGFHLVDAIREGLVQVRPGIAEFMEEGVRFLDGSEQPFDDVILATGYTPALQMLDSLVQTDARGFALRHDRVMSADQPGLYFVGHNYDSTGGLFNIARDAPLMAKRIAETSR